MPTPTPVRISKGLKFTLAQNGFEYNVKLRPLRGPAGVEVINRPAVDAARIMAAQMRKEGFYGVEVLTPGDGLIIVKFGIEKIVSPAAPKFPPAAPKYDPGSRPRLKDPIEPGSPRDRARAVKGLNPDKYPELKKIVGRMASFSPYKSDKVLTGRIEWGHKQARDQKLYVLFRIGKKKYYKRINDITLIN